MDRTAWVVWSVLGVMCVGCGQTGRSARIPIKQYSLIVPQLTERFQASRFVLDRDGNAGPTLVAITNIKNLTTDVIPLYTQWSLMSQLSGRLSELPACRSRDIRFMIPPERREYLQRYAAAREDDELGVSPGDAPTHILSAVFRSVRRAEASDGYEEDLQMLYVLDMQLTDARSREIVWHDSMDFQVQAQGLAID